MMVKELETMILNIENEIRYYEEQQYLNCEDCSASILPLLMFRKKLLDRYVLDNLDLYIDRICEFDERLTEAFRADFYNRIKLRDETVSIQGVKKRIDSNLFMDKPDDRNSFWTFLKLYSYGDETYSLSGIGFAKSFRTMPKRTLDKKLLTFNDTARSLKESRELFLNRPLSSSFYFLYEETYYSLIDIIDVRDFYAWITIRVVNEYPRHKIELYGDQRNR